MTIQAAIEDRLSVLVGLPVWAAGRAAGMLWLQFGDRRFVPKWGGGVKEAGSFALHVDCPWSWTSEAVRLADPDSDLHEIEQLVSPPPVCAKVVAMHNGSFQLLFDNGSAFWVAVEADHDPNAEEYWRLLEPGTDNPHFVVGSGGVLR